MATSPDRSWWVCQLGAREHFSVARALHRRQRLGALLTDIWAPPGSFQARVSTRLRDRYHPDLASAAVQTAPVSHALMSMPHLRFGRNAWAAIERRNALFARWVAAEVRQSSGGVDTLFAYSYAALEALRVGKERGWRTVLGQIDPGLLEAKLMESAYRTAGLPLAQPSEEYWNRWREELQLSDVVIVNSQWSADALTQVGVPVRKIRIVPLAYEARETNSTTKLYPAAFSPGRRLRLLFLGQVNVRKGVLPLLEALDACGDLPIEMRFVGEVQIEVPPQYREKPSIRWIGPVPRGEVSAHYLAADLFLFPTLSDGFGLTQLEAMSYGLPVVASRRCGNVVTHGHDGIILEDVDAAGVETAIRAAAADPFALQQMSHNALQTSAQFNLDDVGGKLLQSVQDQ